LCLWKHHRVLFLWVWHATTDNGWFITSSCFFPPSFLSLTRKKYTFIFFVFGISISILILSILFIYVIISFIKVLFVFNLVLQLPFIMYYFFHLGPYSLDLYFFSLTFLLKLYWFSISSFNQSFRCLIFLSIEIFLLLSNLYFILAFTLILLIIIYFRSFCVTFFLDFFIQYLICWGLSFTFLLL